MTERYDYKVGRPARDDGPTQNLTFRLSTEDVAALNAHVRKIGKTRSAVIRDALEQCGLLEPVKTPGRK